MELKRGQGVCRKNIPPDDATIIDETNIDTFINDISKINIYLRTAEECALNIGNWMVDIYFTDGGMFYIKLPKEMTLMQVKKYCKPVLDRIMGTKLSQQEVNP